jgi:Tol biopolymer transport system component/predicted Ser/Thr protein kinase
MDHPGLVGQTLLHYRVTEKIGEGGMGAVYKALDTHLDRPVALKVLPPDKVADPDRKQRFVQEAKAASALRHPNIVVIHDIAADRGRDFMVMEFVEGQSLDLLIGRKGLKLAEALGYAVQIADGLAKAHAAGIVHRDLKPTNVMVTAEGLVKILDFGLAKLTEDVPGAGAGPTMTMGRDGKPRTEEGYVLGTAAYMSPEQAEGRKIDARSDVFSFGAVLYEMLTGRKAFAGDSRIKTLAAVLNEEPRLSSAAGEAIPPELERVLNRCLRKDPQRRWQTMSDLKVALQELKEDSESGKLKAAAAPAERGKNRTLFIGAATILLVAAAAVIMKLAAPKAEAPEEFEITPLTFDSGATAWPTISLDGNLMAYTSDREGGRNFDIWVQQVAGGKPLRLTDHPADDWFPSFSPDGSQIAFRSERDGGGIYLIDALGTGGEPRRIADKGFGPRFSPDGRFIAFVVIPPSLDPRHYKMYLVSPKGGEPRPFHHEFYPGYIGQGAPLVWSPDGKYLMFQGWRIDGPASRDWWVAPVDGGEVVPTHAIENLGLSTIIQYPVGWAGGHVYFVSGTTIEGVNLFRAPIDPKDWRVLGPAQPITTGPGMKLYPAVMRDGRILFTGMTVSISAWSIGAGSDEAVVSVKAEKLTGDLMQKFSPSISRDGAKVAFTAFGGAQAARIEVRVKDLRTGRETALPMQGVNLGQEPRLSPDGSLLAYRDVVAGKSRTYIVAPGTAAPREICESCLLVDFFPDNAFALVLPTTGRELDKMNLRTGELIPLLTPVGESILASSLSPDGKWLAWLAGLQDGRLAFRVTPLEGRPGEARDTITVAETDYYIGSPAWAPNGRWLYYLSEKNGRCVIMARELDPRTKKPIREEREVYVPPESRFMLNFPMGNGSISVAADRIIFAATEVTGNIYMAKPGRH